MYTCKRQREKEMFFFSERGMWREMERDYIAIGEKWRDDQKAMESFFLGVKN